MSKKLANLDDISSLHDELQNEITADKLYWIRNDAKIRAVQSSQSYDEFRNIVDAAHLTSVTKQDKVPKNSGWNKALSNN